MLGGKCRFAAECYFHASGQDFPEVETSARRAGLRIPTYPDQVDVPGQKTYGIGGTDMDDKILDRPIRAVFESTPYILLVPKLFEYMRAKLETKFELIHDIHERHPQ